MQAGPEAEEELPFRVLEAEEAAGSDRAVPLYEMAVAAGVFSGEQGRRVVLRPDSFEGAV